jgi:hypothetical protein
MIIGGRLNSSMRVARFGPEVPLLRCTGCAPKLRRVCSRPKSTVQNQSEVDGCSLIAKLSIGFNLRRESVLNIG